MADGATGTPTSLGIPTYNTGVDAPNGRGFNSAMSAIDALLIARLSADTVTAAGTRIISSKLLLADAQPAFRINGSGELRWGAGGASATDTNLYRSAANTLKTDNQFFSVGQIVANVGTAQVIQLNPSGVIVFNSDTNLYRSAASVLKTDSSLDVQGLFSVSFGRIYTRQGLADQVYIGDKGGDATTPSVVFGSAQDTNLYRAAAGQVRTDGVFSALNDVYANVLAATRVVIGSMPGTKAGIAFGNPEDTYLWREAAGALKTGASITAAGNISALLASADTQPQIVLSRNFAGSGLPGIGLGVGGTTATDTNLYRSAANQIKTDGGMIIAGALALGAQTPGATGSLKFGDGTTQTTAATSASVIRGKITGTTGAIVRGTGFTAARNSTGNYTITFSSAFAAIPVIVASLASGGSGDIVVNATSTTSATVLTYAGGATSDVAEDADFNFIAYAV